MKPFILNQKGMSLVGVLAAMGILSILVAGVMTVSGNMMKMSQTADTKDQAREEMFIAQMLLSTEATCTANFKKMKISDKANKFDLNGGELKVANPAGVLGAEYMLPSQNPANQTTRLKVSAIHLQKYAGASNLALLIVDFQPKGLVMGGSLKPKEIPLQVLLDGSDQVVKCSASTVANALEEEESDQASKQGNGCNAAPNPGGSGADTAAVKEALQTICDKQTYPVENGLLIKGTDLNSCSTLECKYAMTELAVSESPGGFGGLQNAKSLFTSPEVRLMKRNGYASAAECKKQYPYSESDEVIRYPQGRNDTERTVYTESGGNGNERTYSSKVTTPPQTSRYVCLNTKWIIL